ncbi:MAG: hypothetical protein M0P31_16125 [Solirubrobacteraceae bacterium]|nr:hypothetical protein [Solirubrobacteraceae bacterium]
MYGPRAPTFSDDELLAALRAAAEAVGIEPAIGLRAAPRHAPAGQPPAS